MNGFITTAEAGDLLGVSASRVRQFVLEGRLPAQKIGGRTLVVSVKDVAKFRVRRKSGKATSKKSNNSNGRK